MVREVRRMMLGNSLIPALLFLFLLFFVPESPRCLIKMNDENALTVLKRIVTQKEAQLEIGNITLNLQRESGGWLIPCKRKFKMATIMGVSLAFLP